MSALEALHQELRDDHQRFKAEAQAFEIRRMRSSSAAPEMHSDSNLVYSKWSDAIGRAPASELAKGGLQARPSSFPIDVGTASIDQLDVLLQGFMQRSRIQHT